MSWYLSLVKEKVRPEVLQTCHWWSSWSKNGRVLYTVLWDVAMRRLNFISWVFPGCESNPGESFLSESIRHNHSIYLLGVQFTSQLKAEKVNNEINLLWHVDDLTVYKHFFVTEYLWVTVFSPTRDSFFSQNYPIWQFELNQAQNIIFYSTR